MPAPVGDMALCIGCVYTQSNILHLFIYNKQPESPKPVKPQASIYAFLYTMFTCILHSHFPLQLNYFL